MCYNSRKRKREAEHTLTVYGNCPWKLVIERGENGIKILRAQTSEKHAALPDELFGIPVTVLADHALAPSARRAEGEEVEIVCGRGDPDRTNRDIESLVLPKNLEIIENYAFYGCANLKSIELFGNIKRAGTELFMNCRSLKEFTLHCSEDRAPDLITLITLELSRELSADIYTPESGHIALVFPEYIETYEENICGRNFDLNIQGGGYPYHSVFEHASFNLAAYDVLWDRYLYKEHDPYCALRLAWCRLRTPVGLADKAEEIYTAYLKNRAKDLLGYIIMQRDSEGLSFALERFKPDEEAISYACGEARNSGFTQALALLLEKTHTNKKPAGRAKSFEL